MLYSPETYSYVRRLTSSYYAPNFKQIKDLLEASPFYLLAKLPERS